MNYEEYEARIEGREPMTARKLFSGIGWRMALLYVLVTVLQLGIANGIAAFRPQWMLEPWYSWMLIAVPFYCIALPIVLLLLKKLPGTPADGQTRLGGGRVMRYVVICISATYILNLVSTLINLIIGLAKGAPIQNPIANVVGASSWLYTAIFSGVAAPLVEEYLFRKVLLDKMRPYGDRVAMVVSGALFGLFHGNLSQLLYAFVLGMIFAYVTLRTGTIRYSILLHITINLLFSVVTPFIASTGSTAALGLTGLVILALVVVGLVFMVKYTRCTVYEPAQTPLEPGRAFRDTMLTPGMIAFFLVCLANILLVIVL